MIDLFTASTPNGIKIPIALEELGATYDLRMLALDPAHLKTPEFLAINPNARIPAIRHDTGAGGVVTLFESGAILLHLAEHFGGLGGGNAQARAQTLSWLFLQVAGLGPAMGNAGHFAGRGGPDPYPLERFRGEARRLLGLLNDRLDEHEWLNGLDYSVADIAHFGWARNPGYAGLRSEDFPAVAAWAKRIEQRPATQDAFKRMAARR